MALKGVGQCSEVVGEAGEQSWEELGLAQSFIIQSSPGVSADHHLQHEERGVFQIPGGQNGVVGTLRQECKHLSWGLGLRSSELC